MDENHVTTTTTTLPVNDSFSNDPFVADQQDNNNNNNKSRGQARQNLAEKWATRRRQQQVAGEPIPQVGQADTKVATPTSPVIAKPNVHTNANAAATNATSTGKPKKPKGNNGKGNSNKEKKNSARTGKPSNQQQPPLNPFCYLIQRSWKDVWLHFQKKNLTAIANEPSIPAAIPNLPKQSFPSVLNILHQHALARQLLFIQEESMGTIPEYTSLEAAWRLLAPQRSRVFWLLDLAQLTKIHVQLRKKLKSVEMLYSLRHQSSPPVLQLLQRLGIQHFAVHNAYEYDRIHTAPPVGGGAVPPVVLEDEVSGADVGGGAGGGAGSANASSKQSKMAPAYCWDGLSVDQPNSLVRRLLFSSSDDDNNDNQNHPPASTMPLTVAEPEDVERLIQVATKMARRQGGLPVPPLRFIWKFPVDADGAAMPMQSWKDTWQQLQQVLTEPMYQQHQIVGVGIVVEPESLSTTLRQVQTWLQETSATSTAKLQLHLYPSSPIEMDILAAFLPALSKATSKIVVDVSPWLIANASALCTKIIGVKQVKERRHYYLDDGCYGSLPTASLRVPIPLSLQSLEAKEGGEPAEGPVAADDQETILSTVWGPTCDGLDKVCCDISLPALQRNDWLIFDVGYCPVGTNFNGFDPPDIVYCVLGANKGTNTSVATLSGMTPASAGLSTGNISVSGTNSTHTASTSSISSL